MAQIKITELNEDISISEEELKHVKGGPAYMKLGDIKGEALAQGIYKFNVQIDANTIGR